MVDNGSGRAVRSLLQRLRAMKFVSYYGESNYGESNYGDSNV